MNNSKAQSNHIASFNLENKLAIQGYDPVAYFKQGKAVKGKKEFAVNMAKRGIFFHMTMRVQRCIVGAKTVWRVFLMINNACALHWLCRMAKMRF